jgi:hypothetical protein
MNAIKVIFLDFDGVLNSWPFKKARPLLPRPSNEMSLDDLHDRSIDKAAIGRLNVIVERTKAIVVVSSMWRTTMSRAELRGLLARNGFTGITLDKTPGEGGNRGLQIKQWLTATRRVVDSFVIIDDDDDFEHFGRDRLVQTSYEHGGLLDQHIEPAVKILGKPWRKP